MKEWLLIKVYAAFDPLSIDIPNKTRFESVEGIISAILQFLFGIAGIAAIVALVYSGIMYITAGSDQNKAEAAKKNIIYAVTGIVVILLAYIIIEEVGKIIRGEY